MSDDIAFSLDAGDRPTEAIEAYERLIQTADADESAFQNLVALYYLLNDYGFASYYRIPADLITNSYRSAFRVLDLAERRFGRTPESSFWRAYLPFAVTGERLEEAKLERLLQEGGTYLPLLVLLDLPGGERYAPEARALANSVANEKTARAEYIRSVLEAALGRIARSSAESSHPSGGAESN